MAPTMTYVILFPRDTLGRREPGLVFDSFPVRAAGCKQSLS